MSEYIDREALMSMLNAKAEMAEATPKEVFYAVSKMVALLPSAAVAPAIHAHWIFEHHPRDTGYYFIRIVCSNCGLKTDGKSKYCPNCGAKMDEEDDEDK